MVPITWVVGERTSSEAANSWVSSTNIRAPAAPMVGRRSGATTLRLVRSNPAPLARAASWYVLPRAIIPPSCIRVVNGSISVT